MYARQLIRVYPVQFFAEDERSGFNWGFPVFNDHTLKPVAQKITAPVVAFIVISGKAHLYFTDKLGEIGQFLAQRWYLAIRKCSLVTIKGFISFFYVIICKFVLGKHFHQNVKVVAHKAKP